MSWWWPFGGRSREVITKAQRIEKAQGFMVEVEKCVRLGDFRGGVYFAEAVKTELEEAGEQDLLKKVKRLIDYLTKSKVEGQLYDEIVRELKEKLRSL